MSEANRKSSPDDRTGKKDDEVAGHAKRPGAPRKQQGDVGRVLRSVYDSTLAEDIPDDFLDLLGKLD